MISSYAVDSSKKDFQHDSNDDAFAKARAAATKALELDETLAEALREAYRISGAEGYWQKQIEFYGTGKISWSMTRVASFLAQIGENDQALALSEKAFEKKQIRNLKSPIFDPHSLRTQP